jgi:hypothetical protein
MSSPAAWKKKMKGTSGELMNISMFRSDVSSTPALNLSYLALLYPKAVNTRP